MSCLIWPLPHLEPLFTCLPRLSSASSFLLLQPHTADFQVIQHIQLLPAPVPFLCLDFFSFTLNFLLLSIQVPVFRSLLLSSILGAPPDQVTSLYFMLTSHSTTSLSLLEPRNYLILGSLLSPSLESMLHKGRNQVCVIYQFISSTQHNAWQVGTR